MIERRSLVTRHNPVLREFDKWAPLTVGNGDFAMTVDATGLQTFADNSLDWREKYPVMFLGTLSNWGWHSFPNPYPYTADDYPQTTFESHGRQVPYLAKIESLAEEADFLYRNPHRLHLGRLQFRLTKTTGQRGYPSNLTDIEQTLDLWSGIITSRYRLQGVPVSVQTCCHPALDLIAVRLESPLVRSGQVQVVLHFPYGTDDGKGSGGDWNQPDRHETMLRRPDSRRADFERVLDADRYHVSMTWSGEGDIAEERKHLFVFTPEPQSDTLEFVVQFAPAPAGEPFPTVAESQAASAQHWSSFWSRGGAVELADSADPRGLELERRIVLSQYQTTVNGSGSLSPQESGLIHNSRFGRFHLEMHWWHGAHFPLWGRPDLLAKSLPFYFRIMDRARATARRQGYEGVRWPKCLAADGVQPPTTLEATLVWQQPHPIYYAELLYRANPTRETLEKYGDLVLETAAFMGSFAAWEADGRRHVLGPPIGSAQELYGDYGGNINPTYELAYWSFGLRVAQQWRERMGLARNEKWDHVIAHLSPLPVADGLYVGMENHPETWTLYWHDHPTMLAPLGILPGGPMVDTDTMRRTLHRVVDDWCWDKAWGWARPMTAMTAARLGEPDVAADILLGDVPTRRNHCLPNGLFLEGPDLVYLPTNGGLLTAVAMMAGGWDGAPDTAAPGFPQNGQWQVRAEGLLPMP